MPISCVRLRGHVRDQTAQPDGRERERKQPKDRRDPGNHVLSRERGVDTVAGSHHPDNRQPAIATGQRPVERRGDRSHVSRGSNLDLSEAPLDLREGHVHNRRRRLAQIRVLRVVCNADDLHHVRSRRAARFAAAQANALANRHPPTEELPDERVVDDRDAGRLLTIIVGEASTPQHSDPHDVEVRRRHRIHERPKRPAVRWREPRRSRRRFATFRTTAARRMTRSHRPRPPRCTARSSSWRYSCRVVSAGTGCSSAGGVTRKSTT